MRRNLKLLYYDTKGRRDSLIKSTGTTETESKLRNHLDKKLEESEERLGIQLTNIFEKS